VTRVTTEVSSWRSCDAAHVLETVETKCEGIADVERRVLPACRPSIIMDNAVLTKRAMDAEDWKEGQVSEVMLNG
jgi:hypothetical protein